VEARVIVEPLIAVVRDTTGPAIPLRHACGRRHVAIVVDDVVIGSEVIAVSAADTRTSRIADRVSNKAQVMAAAAEEGVTGVATPIQIQSAKF